MKDLFKEMEAIPKNKLYINIIGESKHHSVIEVALDHYDL